MRLHNLPIGTLGTPNEYWVVNFDILMPSWFTKTPNIYVQTSRYLLRAHTGYRAP